MPTAVYAGTFDPITAGHLSVVDTAAGLFERLYVLTAVNPAKQTLFSREERVEMMQEAVTPWPRVECHATDGLVVEWARARGATYLIRGLRGMSDAEFETTLAHVNGLLARDVRTLFVPARLELAVISSSGLKELARCGADLARFCPPGVERRLRERLLGR